MVEVAMDEPAVVHVHRLVERSRDRDEVVLAAATKPPRDVVLDRSEGPARRDPLPELRRDLSCDAGRFAFGQRPSVEAGLSAREQERTPASVVP